MRQLSSVVGRTEHDKSLAIQASVFEKATQNAGKISKVLRHRPEFNIIARSAIFASRESRKLAGSLATYFESVQQTINLLRYAWYCASILMQLKLGQQLASGETGCMRSQKTPSFRFRRWI